MARAAAAHKAWPPTFTTALPFCGTFALSKGGLHPAMMGLALCMFIGLFAFGHDLVGWTDPSGQVQMGLFMAFLFGIVCGYRTKG